MNDNNTIVIKPSSNTLSYENFVCKHQSVYIENGLIKCKNFDCGWDELAYMTTKCEGGRCNKTKKVECLKHNYLNK